MKGLCRRRLTTAREHNIQWRPLQLFALGGKGSGTLSEPSTPPDWCENPFSHPQQRESFPVLRPAPPPPCPPVLFYPDRLILNPEPSLPFPVPHSVPLRPFNHLPT